MVKAFDPNSEYAKEFIDAGVLHTRNGKDIDSLLSSRRPMPAAMADDVLILILENKVKAVKRKGMKSKRSDTECMQIVENGETNAVQRTADEAAKKAGYRNAEECKTET